MPQTLHSHALSHTQLAMMQRCFAEPESYCNFEFQHLFLRGEADIDRLDAAWQAVFRRHPILNSVIRWEREGGGLRQIYRPGLPVVRLLRPTDPAGRQALIQQRRIYRVDLRRGCFELILLPGPEGVDMLINTHHIVYDGWSSSVILAELLEEYRTLDIPASPPAPEYTFEAFQAQQSRLDSAPLLATYRRMLQGYRHPAVNRPKGSSAFSSKSSLEMGLPIATEEVKRLCGRFQASPGAILTALWASEALRLYHADDLVLGVVFSCRSLPIPGLEQGVGPFLSVFPLRVRASGLPQMITAVHRDMAELQQLQHIPFDYVSMVESIPFFSIDSVALIQNYPSARPSGPWEGPTIERIETLYFPDNQITFEIQNRETGLTLLYRYDNRCFSCQSIERSAGRVCADIDSLTGR